MGKNIFSAHREHIYQRLTPDPAKHRQVTNVYLGLAALSGLAASFGATGTVIGLGAGGALVCACCLFMAFLPLISRKTGYGYSKLLETLNRPDETYRRRGGVGEGAR